MSLACTRDGLGVPTDLNMAVRSYDVVVCQPKEAFLAVDRLEERSVDPWVIHRVCVSDPYALA